MTLAFEHVIIDTKPCTELIASILSICVCLTFACLGLGRVGWSLQGHLQSGRNLSLEEVKSLTLHLNTTQLNVSATESIYSLV